MTSVMQNYITKHIPKFNTFESGTSTVEFLTTPEAAWYIISGVYVCQTITFESHDIESSYLHMPYISRQYSSSSQENR